VVCGSVDDRWWDEVDVAGVDEDFPAGIVHVAVVRLTQENAVTESRSMYPQTR
jgi:hypothetical protein